MIDKVWVYRENRGMRILAASRDLREVFFFLENHQPGNCSCSTYANSANGTTSPQRSQSFVTDWYCTSYHPRPPTETSPPGAAIVDLKRRRPALATTATQDSRAPSTVHCCIPRKKKGVRDAMDHVWPDRVCSHVTVGERNKTGLNSAGGRCWTTQGEKNRRHKSPPDKKKKKNQIVALLTHDRNSCICIIGLYRLVNSYL